jgi:hypothetical protein
MSSLVPEPHDMRASDAEREVVAETLRAHAAEGRLDPEELEERLERAYSAQLRGDLVPLTADLPVSPPAKPRPSGDVDVPPVVPLAVLLIVIWALTGAGYFWPMWPIAAMVLATVKHARCSRPTTK